MIDLKAFHNLSQHLVELSGDRPAEALARRGIAASGQVIYQGHFLKNLSSGHLI